VIDVFVDALDLAEMSLAHLLLRRIASSMGLAAAAGISARLGQAETSVAPNIIHELITSGPARSASV
jgi:hypothetical protein